MLNKKIILSLDTSMQGCSVAISKNNYIDNKIEICNKNQTNKIFFMIEKILYKNNLKLQNINLIGVTHGPGKFTGIRTAIGIAKGISFGMSIPIMSVSTLAVLSEQANRKFLIKNTRILVAMKSKNQEIFFGMYLRDKNSIWKEYKSDAILNFEQIKNIILHLKKKWTAIGNGWNKNIIQKTKMQHFEILIPNAVDIIPFAKNFLMTNKYNKLNKISPNYLYKINY